jgi:uncharacterized protein DUF5674
VKDHFLRQVVHADANAALLGRGSEQKHLWGINLYPDKKPEDWIERIALINIRPATGNRSMEIKDPQQETYKRLLAEITKPE